MDELQTGPRVAIVSSYGLQQSVLSPMETLAQSISLIAPSTTPAFTVPLVFALAGAGSGLAYVLATVAMVLVALCIAAFSRESASPGSLYSYASISLPPTFAAGTAFALFFAYILTASSVMGGFLGTLVSLVHLYGHADLHIPSLLPLILLIVAVVWAACSDIKISTRLMMTIEFLSMLLILIVIVVVLWKHGLHLDLTQFRVRGFSAQGVRLGGMLAIFSFVGFESATTLGSEAKEPLRSIPRAVIGSTLVVGLFFLVSVYGEVLGFRGAAESLADTTTPFQFLSKQAGITFVGLLIECGVLVSMAAATLACVIASSRVLLMMAHDGLIHKKMASIYKQSETPGPATLLSALLAFVPIAVLAQRGVSGADIYGYMGTLAVFGFLTAYLVVAVALIVHRVRHDRLTTGVAMFGGLATLAMVATFVGNVFPLPPPPYRYFPAIYGIYFVVAMVWYMLKRRADNAASR